MTMTKALLQVLVTAVNDVKVFNESTGCLFVSQRNIAGTISVLASTQYGTVGQENILYSIVARTIMEENSRSDDLMQHFQILMRVSHDIDYIQQLGPPEMDKLGDEIAMALQRCAVPELSGIDQEDEVRINNDMVDSIVVIHERLGRRAQRSMNSHDGALLTLFEKTIITPANMQALFCMCDPTIRTGDIRCMAIIMLSKFAQIMQTYKIHLRVPKNDKKGSTSFSSFDEMLVTTMIKVSSQGTAFCLPCSRNVRCHCATAPWRTVVSFLSRTLVSTSDETLDFVNSQDWPAFLQSDTFLVGNSPGQGMLFYDMALFTDLHHWVCRVLVADPNNTKAKTFLREQLGSCHELLRKVLRRIIAGEIFTHEAASSHGRSPWDEVDKQVRVFFQQFVQCLVPVPIDRETMSLVRRALSVVKDAVADTMTQWHHHDFNSNGDRRITLRRMDILLSSLEGWRILHNESEQAQWKRFHDEYFSSTMVAHTKQYAKQLRKSNKEISKAQRNIQDGEMCGNCFVLEKTLLDESNQTEGLMKCTRCRQMKYCSRECQVEHWKKAHKKHCKKAEKAASSAQEVETVVASP